MANPTPETQQESFQFRLNRYHFAADMLGIFVPLIAGIFMYVYQPYFPWIIHPVLNIWAFGILVAFQAIDFALFHTFHKKIFFNLSRYIYVVFFTVFLYVSGGTQSTFMFLMMYPLLVSAVDLDPAMTRNIGVAIIVAFFALLLTEPAHLTDPTVLVGYFLRIILFVCLSYLMYKLVRETLAQKYEKEETNRKFTELIQVDQLKDDFLSVAQHQLRTPLSGIKWALESMAGDKGITPENRELIASGISRAEDAITIVNEMLKTVEEGGGSLTLSREQVDVAHMIRDIIEELNYVAKRKEVSVSLSAPHTLTASVEKRKLKPAFTNIIDNALKYSPRGHVRIHLAEERAGDSSSRSRIIFSVIDDGIGISEDDMPFVFSRLYRGKNAISLEPDESGVGLYTAKRMIELHGGTIALTSKLGGGTTVMVALPK